MFEIEGLEVQVLSSEGGEDGAPVFVLVHGIGVAASYFEPLARALLAHGRVVAVNLPGFGPTKDPDRSIRITQFARIAREAVARSGVGVAVWVGHSMGTQVVVEALAQDPTIAQRAVLLSPVVNQKERSLRLLAWRFARSATRESIPSAAASVRALLGGGLFAFFRTLPVMLAYPMDQRIREVTAEMLLVTGELDETSPRRWLEELAAHTSGDAHVRVVPGAAHQAMFTHADEVAGLVLGSTDADLPGGSG